jgi:hypothetical protein
MHGWIEGLVVAVFALGWGVIELVALRLDRRRTRDLSSDATGVASASPASPESSVTKNA